jgi:hypothetical protein
MLASCAFGLHRNICVINATTLRHAKYLLKSQLGISETSYSHSDLKTLYGTGQGSANSLMLWCLISTILFDAYASKAKCATFKSPDGTQVIQILMIGFVDDTSGIIRTILTYTLYNHRTIISILLKKMLNSGMIY